MKVLVTGSEGFIGKHLVKKLRGKGFSPVCWDIKNGVDITKDIEGKFDVVFHLAAFISVPESMEYPKKYLMNNVVGTQNVLSQIKSERFVFISSCSVEKNKSVYAITKTAGELLTSLHPNSLSVRFYNVFGPGQRNGLNVFPIFFRQLRAGERPTLFSSGEQIRDYVYVEDLVEELVALGLGKKKGVLEIGYGKGVKTKKLLADMQKIMGTDIKPILVKNPRPGDVMKAIAKKGIKERIGYLNGLKKTIKWMRENL